MGRYVVFIVVAAVLVAVNGAPAQTGDQITVTTKVKNGRNVTTVTVPDRGISTLDCPKPDDPQKVFVVQVDETLYIAPRDGGEDCENQYVNPDKLCGTVKASFCLVQARDPSSDAGCKGRPLRIKYSCVEPPRFTSGPVLDNMGIPFEFQNGPPGGLASAGLANIAGKPSSDGRMRPGRNEQ